MHANRDDDLAPFKQLFDTFAAIISVDVSDYVSGKTRLTFPIVPQSLLESLCTRLTDIFRKEPVVLDLPHTFAIVGDLHGHILDLLRILKNNGFPPERNYLFLGDIVDRGEFSVESITLVYLMKLLWPSNVFLIRGNHEFAEMSQRCGFSAELLNLYQTTTVESAFLESFAWMPLGAVLDNTVLCIHGGIGPSFKRIDQLRTTQRPLHNFGDEPATTVLWSDPLTSRPGFHPSSRGSGYFFGCDVLLTFLKESKLTAIVRGHECVEHGVDVIGGGKLITVFSASFYCGDRPNRSGLLLLMPNGEREAETYPPLPYFERDHAHFIPLMHILRMGPRCAPVPKATSRIERLPALPGAQRPKDYSHTSRPMEAGQHIFVVPVDPRLARSAVRTPAREIRTQKQVREIATRMRGRGSAPISGLRVRCPA